MGLLSVEFRKLLVFRNNGSFQSFLDVLREDQSVFGRMGGVFDRTCPGL